MNREVELFLKEFNRITSECQKFCFMSRGKEFQEEAVEQLRNLKQGAIDLKKQMIKSKDEDSANIMLSIENLISAMSNELKTWIALKEDNPNKAWDFLIDAQGAARTALQTHSIVLNLNAEGYAEKLHFLEKLLFPPQMFFSPSLVVESAKCSICGREYGECGHVVGKAYMGKMCYKKITKIKTAKEVSIVEEPANKRARMFKFTDNDQTRDFMTWRVVENREPR